ncbi:MAG TPA: hypothetical protein VEI95_04890 [Acidobacteriota bacterium]|nr:hypothetical protein [Acidobacteriota bacterium]
MKHFGKTVSLLVFAGTLAGSAFAADGFLLKEPAGQNYCHMKFPAIRRSTLDTDHPAEKSTQTGDVIDFYGPCDESPTGADQVLEQKHQETFMFDRAYADGE